MIGSCSSCSKLDKKANGEFGAFCVIRAPGSSGELIGSLLASTEPASVLFYFGGEIFIAFEQTIDTDVCVVGRLDGFQKGKPGGQRLLMQEQS